MNSRPIFAAVSALAFGFLGMSGATGQTRRDGSIEGETHSSLEPLIPTGQIVRYVVTNMVSEPNKAATAVSITNNSLGACNVSIDWFRAAGGTAVCSTSFTSLGAGQMRTFCSRNPGATFVTCSVTCSPALTFHEGIAVVGSTNTAACAKIAVDARIFFFNGSDTSLGGVYGPKIVRKSTGNSGD